MSGRWMRSAAAALAVLLGISLATSGCATKGANMDSAGMTQADVESLSLEEQYNLMRDRYEQMHAQFADAQRVISREPWIWISYGISPDAGTFGPIDLPGAGDDNSYHLQISTSIDVAGGQGDRADLDPMLAHFASQGWESEIEQRGTGENWWVANAVTDEGSLFVYTVQENGMYNLSLYSGTFWGDRRALAQATQERRPADWRGPETSVPGEYVAFPKWSAPLRDSDAS